MMFNSFQVNISFLIFALLSPFLLMAQNQQLLQETGDNVCECFHSRYIPSGNIDMTLLTECYEDISELLKKKLIDSVFKTVVDTKQLNDGYIKGKNAGLKLFDDLQPILIDSCDSYYSYVQALYDDIYQSLTKQSNQHAIDSLSQLIKSDRKRTDLLWQRGGQYFGIGKVGKARRDFKKLLKIYPNNELTFYFLGWIHERSGEYRKALELYEKSIPNPIDPFPKFKLLILKRKIREGKP